MWVILYIVMTGVTIGIYMVEVEDFVPGAVFAGCFWPISLPALISYKITLALGDKSKEKQEFRREQKRLADIENNLREQEIRKALKELNNSL